MLKYNSKKTFSLIAFCSFYSIGFSDPTNVSNQESGYVSGEKIRTGQLQGAYNQSADYKCSQSQDIFFTGDYIFWNWAQDAGLSLGGQTSKVLTSTSNINIEPVMVNPGYASGFQVGIGYSMRGMDDWNVYAEYTWYKNSGYKSTQTQAAITSPSISYDINLNTDVSLKYDNADFLIGRPFYFGKKLTANFYTGLKALWVTRKATISNPKTNSFTFLSSSFLDGTINQFDLHDKVSSWSLGPKFGMDSNWLLGYGLKLLSNIAVSAVYTRYTQKTVAETKGELHMLTLPVNISSSSQFTENNYGTIRPILETYFGLGWGSFFCKDRFHLDLSLGYDFNVFWNYATEFGGTVPPVSMYLHGVNAQLRFDF